MPWNPDSQNSNRTHNSPYTSGGFEKAKLRKLLLLAVGIVAAIAIAVLITYFLPESQQSKYAKSATAAARKQTPNAEAKDVKVAGGFAIAIVSSPTAQGQGKAGNTTVFKVNNDGSMTQIAAGSSFSPLDLLGLGISLSTQAKLTSTSLGQVKKDFASACGYDGGVPPGFSGLGGSFGKNNQQIDYPTLTLYKQKLSATISNQNIKSTPGDAVICVDALRKDSIVTTDTSGVTTFTLQAWFLTSSGTHTTHTLTIATGSNFSVNFLLDGKDIYDATYTRP